MRLDLFLKNTRLFKRRSLAGRFARNGGVEVNGRPAKPGKQVGPGDLLTLRVEGEPVLDVEILAEARRPVAKGREGDFVRVLK